MRPNTSPLLQFKPTWETYVCALPSIYGGVGGCPPPVSPPVAPPPQPAEPHLIGSLSAVTASFWISGALLHFRSGDGNDYGETGASQPTPPGPAGIVRSVYIDGSEDMIYIDDSGVHRKPSKTSLGAKPGGALLRSLRYDDTGAPSHDRARVQWAGATNHFKWHNGL